MTVAGGDDKHREGDSEFVDVAPEVALENLIGDLPPGELRLEDVRSATRSGDRYFIFCHDGRRYGQVERGVVRLRQRPGGEEAVHFRLGAVLHIGLKPPRATRREEN
jgi:hypothetical protein